MVHKVILNIISEKEEYLKEKLQESMEMDIDNPQVLFRFTRELYKGKDDIIQIDHCHSDFRKKWLSCNIVQRHASASV